MRRFSRRSLPLRLAIAALAWAAASPQPATAQQVGQERLNANGDPVFDRNSARRRPGFSLFGNADRALSEVKTPSSYGFQLFNTGQLADARGLAYNDNDGPAIAAGAAFANHFRYLMLSWATPPSTRLKMIEAGGAAAAGLAQALGGGFNMRSHASTNGNDQQLATDGTLGAYHAGERSTLDRSCLDHGGGFFGAGNPLLATSDCPPTWGSLGWQGRKPVPLDVYLSEARANPADFGFDFWRFPVGEPDPAGKLERQFGSFQTYGFFNDYSRDDLCGTGTTRTYGRVIRPAPAGAACPDVPPTKPGYPLGLDVRVDAFAYGIPALQDIAFYQITVVNNSRNVYGVGIDYDSLYIGLLTGYFGSDQENMVYYWPELSTVFSSARCIQPNCNSPKTAAEFTIARLAPRTGGNEFGMIALTILKSPIGDLRNKLFTRPGSEFSGVAVPESIKDDTITFNHAHMCGFRACAGSIYTTGETFSDHMQRQFGIFSSTEVNVLGTRPITDPTLSGNNAQVLWHTFRSYDYPATPPIGPGPAQFPQTGGFNRWVPGATGAVGKWDWNDDGVQDTLFYDSCSSKAGGTTLQTSCAGLFSDTLPNKFANAYANVGSTLNVGPISFAAGDTTSFVIAVTAACCGRANSDSSAIMTKVMAAIGHYLNFYLGPEPLPVDTIAAVDVVGGNVGQASVTLRFTETAERARDPFLVDLALKTADPAPGTASERLLQLNPFLADTLLQLGLPFGVEDTSGITGVGNFDKLYIFKSCDGGNTFTANANCAPSPATGGPFAALGWQPYATLQRDPTTGDVPNQFTDPNVSGGNTYMYVVVGGTRGAELSLQTGSAVSPAVINGTDTVFVCTADCEIQTIAFAPALFNPLASSGPNVATVYVPTSLAAGGSRPIISVQTTRGPVPAERLIVTAAANRPVAGTYTVQFYDSVVVRTIDSLDVDARAKLGTRTAVLAYRGTTRDSLSSDALGGVGLSGGTTVSATSTSGTGFVRRTTVTRFTGLVAVVSRGTEAILVTSRIDANATPETFHSSTAFPGFTVAFAPAPARAFNATRGEVFIGPDGQLIAPLVTPFIRLNTASTTVAATGQGGLYTLTWTGKPFGPNEPFRLNLADPAATEAAITASLNARNVGTTGLVTPEAAAAVGATDLVPVRVPFTIRNESFNREVFVAMRRRASNTILLGTGQDTMTVRIPEDAWVPGDNLILLERIGTELRPTFTQVVLGCPAVGTRPSCNPLALNTPGATAFISTPVGTQQSFLYNPVLTTEQQFSFTVQPQRSGQELALACATTGGDATVCAEIRQSIKDVGVAPNPYVTFSGFNVGGTGLVRPLMFTGVPAQGTIRIYTVSGQFVQQIRWTPEQLNDTGDLLWDLRTREGNLVAGGLYLFMVTGQDANGRELGSHMGKFVIIR